MNITPLTPGCGNIRSMVPLTLIRIEEGRHGKGGITPLLIAAVLAVVNGGCSTEGLKELGYTLGTQYSCMQSNNHRPNEGVKDLECLNPGTGKVMSYKEYQEQRKDLLKKQD